METPYLSFIGGFLWVNIGCCFGGVAGTVLSLLLSILLAACVVLVVLHDGRALDSHPHGCVQCAWLRWSLL
jgi:hypothetical protein